MICSHCGREVQGTVHSPRSYKVDYYLCFTGDIEPTVIKSTDGETKDKVFQRLVRARLIVTCSDCWARSEVRAGLPPSCPDPPPEGFDTTGPASEGNG